MITVVCPVYNEAKYIGQVIQFFLSAKPIEKELIIMDGGSKDGTQEIIEGYRAQYPNIRLLHNPDKYVPFALNKAIKESKGDIIVRLDAHTVYAPDYFEKILETFGKTDADIVGGPMRAKGHTAFQQAVAYATSTSMGVGNSHFHNENYEGYVDSVYLGAWRKAIFSDTGYFDEQLVRNQDDEFHYRAKSLGKKIYLNPAIRSAYYPRDTVKKLCRQYFQYGLYKPLVLKKVGSEAKLRHLIPGFFALYLVSLPVAFVWWVWILPLFLYLGLAAFFASRVLTDKGLATAFYTFIVYPVLHISYGAGFILGLGKRDKNRKK